MASPGSREQRSHLGLGDLGKVLVPGADCNEAVWLQGAHDTIGHHTDALHGVGRAHRSRRHHRGRSPRSSNPYRHLEGCARRDAVVDHHHTRSRQLQPGTDLAQGRGPCRQCLGLPGDLLIDVRLRDPQSRNDPGVDDRGTGVGDGPERELRVARRPQLVGEEDVEGSAEQPCHDGGHRDSAPRNAKDHNRRRDHEPAERLRQTLPGLGPIAVAHRASVPTYPRWVRRGLLLANPSASGFTGAGFRRVVGELEAGFAVDVEWPRSPDETREWARSAAGRGFEAVFAMGGDGVAHHAANGLIGSTAALGLIPAGTTNVLARILGIPTKPHRAARALATMPTVPTRLARVTARRGTAQHSEYATFAVGVGFDAAVVEEAERRPHSKVRLGGVHFAGTAIGQLLSSWRSALPNLRVECDGDRTDAVTVLTQVHGPYTYLGRLPLHITPSGSSGVAAVAAADLEVHRASEIVARAAFHRPLPERLDLRVWEHFTHLRIDAEPETAFQADGEHLGLADRIEITPVEEALAMLRDPDALQP